MREIIKFFIAHHFISHRIYSACKHFNYSYLVRVKCNLALLNCSLFAKFVHGFNFVFLSHRAL